MDWRIHRNWGWPLAICVESRIFWQFKILGKTYDSRTWSSPKLDPTLQMQISMQTQVKNSNANAVWSNFYFRFSKICSPLEREKHFWKPTVSNRPSKIHFLEHWRLQMKTHWAIFLAFMALKLFFSPLFRFSRPSEFWKIVGKTCGFCKWSRPANRHHLSHLQFCTFLMAGAFCSLLLMAIHAFLPPFGSVWSDFCLCLGPFSLRFSTAWASQVQMQVHMQVHMQSQIQLLFD